MRLAQPFDVLVAIPRQADLEFVLAVLREGVLEDGAASRADGKAGDVALLGEIRGHADGFAARRAARTAHRETADLSRGRQVAVEQRRRQIAHRHVVEPVAGIVCRQERRDVDVDRQEVANRVAILGACQPPDGRRPAGIGMRSRRPIERAFEVGDDGLVRGVVRPGFAHRRHLPRPQLADDLLPDRGMCGNGLTEDRFELQPALFMVGVVAREAGTR